MIPINILFSHFPKKTASVERKVESVSGKSSGDQELFASINIYIQENTSDIEYGIVAGETSTVFVDSNQVPSFDFKRGDKLFIDSQEYTVEGVITEEANPIIDKYFQLEVKKVK